MCESACLDEKICEDFGKKKNLIVKDYDEKDVFNAHETFFSNALHIKLCM